MSSLKLYHGAGANFSTFRQEFARSQNDHYGGGLAYLTTSRDIAVGYAKSSAKRTKGDPIVYFLEANFKKVFDIDATFTGKELLKFLPSDVETFARGAGLIKFSTNVYEVKAKLKDGRIALTGKQVFDGLTKIFNGATAKARDFLIKLGYDSLRYNGGLNMMTAAHDVYIAYNARSLRIISRDNLNQKEPSFADIALGKLQTT